jgi:hypothetical protein
VKITTTGRVGILSMQNGRLMPDLCVDVTGDIYALDPNQILKVVRDGRVIASTDVKKLYPPVSGEMRRYLFIYRNGDDRILAVLRPRRFIDHRPAEEDIDFKFRITTP